jgi:uncharacterized protein (TIGR00369 family)
MSVFKPKSPRWEARVRDSFAHQGIMDHVGASLARVEPGAVDIAVGFRKELTQQHGFFHAGVVATIADSAAGYAAFSLMPDEASVLTIELKINLLAPADGERLIARGRVIKPGRTITVAQAEVFALKNGAERQCALLTATLMAVSHVAEPGG